MRDPHRREEFYRLKAGYLRFKGALYDRETGLFAFPFLFDRIHALLAERDQIGILYLEIPDLDRIERRYGWTVFDRLRVRVALALAGLRETVLGKEVLLACMGVHGTGFLLFLPEAPEGGRLSSPRLDLLAQEVQESVQRELQEETHRGGAGQVGVDVGYSLLREIPLMRFERQVYLAVEEARGMRRQGRHREWMRRIADLRQILQEGSVITHFQPIVRTDNQEIVGYEALTRGPRDSFFEAPTTLFDFSEQIGASMELDGLCRFRALADAQGMRPGLKLFLNSLPTTIQDAGFRGANLLRRIEESGLSRECIVIEITERIAIEDFQHFGREVDQLRQRGFQVAIDDVGTGYSSLQAVSELRPEFLKVDMSLIRNIDRSLIKRGLVKTLVEMGDRIGSRVIAEGIEREEELQVLMECGVRYGQGFYFAHPAPPFPTVARSPVRDS